MVLRDRDTLAAGLEKEGDNKENLQLHHWNLNFASNSPVAPGGLSFQISTNEHKVETSANVNKH